MNMQECKICNNNAQHHAYSTEKDSQVVDCSYCGKYYLMHLFETDIYNDKSNFYKVSSWIREQNDEFHINPEISQEVFEDKLNMRDKRIKEKFDLMMQYFSNATNRFQLDKKILVKCWMKNENEFAKLYQKAVDTILLDGPLIKMLSGFSYPIFLGLTFDGLEYIENLANPNQSSKNIFVAFNFEDNLKEVFNVHVKSAIEENGFNYVVVNQDNVEHNKSINDEIIVKLKSSRIVIADFTNHRPSVYFEAGFAMGMNIPIIWTCQEGHDQDMSFDTRQFPHIIWKDKDDLVKRVMDRIKVIL
ncbi:MAG: hypothetical protein WBK95_07010 [Sulfurimonas sp.]